MEVATGEVRLMGTALLVVVDGTCFSLEISGANGQNCSP